MIKYQVINLELLIILSPLSIILTLFKFYYGKCVGKGMDGGFHCFGLVFFKWEGWAEEKRPFPVTIMSR